MNPTIYSNLFITDSYCDVNTILLESLIKGNKSHDKMAIIRNLFNRYESLISPHRIIQSKINLFILFSQQEQNSSEKLVLFSEAINLARHNIKYVDVATLAPIIFRMDKYTSYADLISFKSITEGDSLEFSCSAEYNAGCGYRRY